MIRVLSLGAGVQSSTLLLMAARGEFADRLDVAVFSDTQWEGLETYEHLHYLAGVEAESWRDEGGRERWRAVPGIYTGGIGGVPVHVVTAGDIRTDLISAAAGKGEAFASLPVFVASTAREGMMKRQCTTEYKIVPVQQECRRLLGLRPRQRSPRHVAVEMWMGISMDELTRMKPSREPWIEKLYPLIDRGMDRRACVAWCEANGFRVAPRSACKGCPFHADHEWRALRTAPADWADVVDVDRAIRRLPRIDGDVFLHRSLRPLDEVDFSTAEERGQGHLFDGFADECEGMCGV